ncbi:MAG: cyclic nucleotide-binding protein [Anaerolineales bacterium]|jgi:CRP/FNR family transcriptional regulator/CRP/FNR family cyclic AMP-dependent transcriptional regulator|nr:cyclic nucleotide-binding protein [Anaerolineales bacterium]MBM2847622.1 cyclic nucleotide-binding protein [Anaerolineales bacterium]
MDTVELLKGVDMFEGLTEQELRRVAAICREAKYAKGQIVTSQGEEGDEMFIVRDGLVEVTVGEAGEGPRTVVNLGTGQVVGEMALVDRGPRSATVRCVTDATLNVIERDAFENLCQSSAQIGMVVYRNLAADLSFKLRHRHLSRR